MASLAASVVATLLVTSSCTLLTSITICLAGCPLAATAAHVSVDCGGVSRRA
ncbi:uncharacterized protein BDR25DRAFT_354741 [Lindgomyces ingoldianus]|uniref:Uncharacterized protein n=1 Tax=Lindgomyces ingoldianus TaxID=673940 RepID=A0ACB6QY42_9PLEO|nr:uncharacterized protein BDR25DRAFT_354741 [Lindgomyces ingoldianus]KAF2471488.1 hypothetical protein BDR25DRAFT_354741 [Lindgomyces ingoldianus]